MTQCYLILVLIVYSAPLIVESSPIHEDARIRQPDSFPRKPAKPPFLPDASSPSGRRIQWLLLFFQVILLGILAGLIISVMSVDKIHLRIWMNTGGEKQRFIFHMHLFMYTANSQKEICKENSNDPRSSELAPCYFDHNLCPDSSGPSHDFELHDAVHIYLDDFLPLNDRCNAYWGNSATGRGAVVDSRNRRSLCLVSEGSHVDSCYSCMHPSLRLEDS